MAARYRDETLFIRAAQGSYRRQLYLFGRVGSLACFIVGEWMRPAWLWQPGPVRQNLRVSVTAVVAVKISPWRNVVP